MTQPITNICCYKAQRHALMLKLRAEGVALTEIGKQIGFSKAWTCKLLKACWRSITRRIGCL
jgi:hypothetical protein